MTLGDVNDPAVGLAAIILAAVAAQMVAARFRIPAIIPLLVAGVALGPSALNAFNPHALLGDLLDPFVALAVAERGPATPSPDETPRVPA